MRRIKDDRMKDLKSFLSHKAMIYAKNNKYKEAIDIMNKCHDISSCDDDMQHVHESKKLEEILTS